MMECWEEQPKNRPTFQWLCFAVKRLLEDQQVGDGFPIFEKHELRLRFKHVQSKKRFPFLVQNVL